MKSWLPSTASRLHGLWQVPKSANGRAEVKGHGEDREWLHWLDHRVFCSQHFHVLYILKLRLLASPHLTDPTCSRRLMDGSSNWIRSGMLVLPALCACVLLWLTCRSFTFP